MQLRPIPLRIANAFVNEYHRHSKPTWGCRFCLGAYQGDELLGVAIVARPVSRVLDDGLTAEVTRLCVKPDAPRNTCSFLYGAARRAWGAMGGTKVVTYTLVAESGASLRGAGWTPTLASRPHSWSTAKRSRVHQPIYDQQKLRWECKA